MTSAARCTHARGADDAAGVVTVGRVERDALWELIRTLLASIGDIFWAVDDDRPNDARMLRHRYRDLMRLLDDIGWTRVDPCREFAITMDPDALMRALLRLHEHAIERLYERADGGGVDREELQSVAIVAGVCGTLLVQLAYNRVAIPDAEET
ncbi:hypothetical protein [Conexibacter sp. CPCC 206217]|uniref:hypothetical protein n=1 Tax=Conexibacter sp. CPCC 206217 TaxID=3064574 RepID=UPI00271BF0E8|nr:hypothetical protein [Conexibacter sp. CPCC 206217]MDO8209666.1 hypothetical protein [Conexibacter sp. CPCC 206217]